MWIPRKINGIPTGEKFLQKFDLWGWADLAAVKPHSGGTLYVQTTTQDHAAERRDKILASPTASVVLRAGNAVEVHGWAKKGGRGKRKLWQANIYRLSHDANGALEFTHLQLEIEDDGSEAENLFASEPSLVTANDDGF